MNEHDLSQLPPAAQAYIRELEARAAANVQHIAELNDRIKLLEEQFRLAQSKCFAPSSEKRQDRVFDEAEQMAVAEPVDDDENDDALAPPDTGLPEPDQPAGRKRGRKPLPAELPRQRIEYDLTEDQRICPCCQGSMHRLGEEVSEQLHIEVKVSVLQHVRFKYDADETTVQVLKEEGRAAQSKSYMWVYRSAEDSEQPVVLFDYQPGRGQEYPQAFLAGYEGMLMTDGYSAWRTLEGVTHFGCLAHARRAFVDAQQGQKKPSARVQKALEYFKALYQVETLARGELPEGETRVSYTYRLRQQHSVPLLEALKAWLDQQAPQVLPESLLGKTIAYARNQWEYLSRYVVDGRAPIDNNVIERDIRPFCTGRKAWLFADTVAGAKASAMIYSLMLTCRACDVEPYAYLLHVLTELPQRAPDADISDLLPFSFARQQSAPPHPV
ncbi:IS66 family transposase [Cupriavidus oxalaticus]|uniref:IS66 family transposase n=1 Tax=Cupriavidus oxalaticus TaxID=96344 RepID=UPI004033FAC5